MGLTLKLTVENVWLNEAQNYVYESNGRFRHCHTYRETLEPHPLILFHTPRINYELILLHPFYNKIIYTYIKNIKENCLL